MEEVEKLWRLTPHPHLVRLYSAWEQRGYLYMLTEYCERGSLDQLLDERADDIAGWPEEQLWGFLADIALGLKVDFLVHVQEFLLIWMV